MLYGETVIIKRPLGDGVDSHGNPVKAYKKETVSNVLVNTPQTQAVTDAETQQTGTQIAYSLAFPISYKKSLKGCLVIMPWLDESKQWQVIGDPQPIPLANLPKRLNKWNLRADVVAYGN